MHHIHARFSLGEVTRIRCYAPPKDNGDKEWKPIEGVRVRLSPVSGEPFGSATPNGQLEMVIADQAAVALFNAAPVGQEVDAIFTFVEQEDGEPKQA